MKTKMKTYTVHWVVILKLQKKLKREMKMKQSTNLTLHYWMQI